MKVNLKSVFFNPKYKITLILNCKNICSSITFFLFFEKICFDLKIIRIVDRHANSKNWHPS